MAKKNSKILTSLSPVNNIGVGSIWDESNESTFNDDRGRSTAGGVRGASKKKGKTRSSTSVPASSRANLLDNNILALSTGTIDERSEAARRICG
jgi:hypothetical protein